MAKHLAGESKANTLSRRSLLTSGVPHLALLVVLPQVLVACGTAESEQKASGTQAAPTSNKSATKKSNSTNKRKNESADAKASRAAQKTEAQPANDQSLNEADDDVPAVEPAETDDTTTPVDNPQNQPTAPQSNVRGAMPDGGFFSSGAPQLTREQIMAGQQIRGKCENGLHELMIEPEHLQALARGESVTVKSTTHTHIGNPTVHSHSVRYTPMMG